MQTKTVPEMLEAAAELYRERNMMYGDSYKIAGQIFEILFPGGICISSPDNFNRFAVLNFMVNKLIRYAANWNDGHKDSLDDLCVYTMMLQELDNANLSD